MKNLDRVSFQQLDKDLRNLNYPAPVLARIIFLNFLRNYFYWKEPGNFKYNEDEKITEIRIEDSWPVEEAAAQKIPSIIVTRTQFMMLPSTFNGGMHFLDISKDIEYRVNLLTTNMIFQCISPLLLESELLASEVFNLIFYCKEEIQQLGIHQIKAPVIGVPQQVPSFGGMPAKIEAYSTPVSCQIFMVDRWSKRHPTEAELREARKVTGMEPEGFNMPLHTLNDINIKD